MRVSTKLLTLLVLLALSAGAAVAGCGHKDSVEGTLASVDTEKNVVVVEAEDGKKVELTLTEATKVTDAKGEQAKLADLVGQKVKVVSEHSKIDSIATIA